MKTIIAALNADLSMHPCLKRPQGLILISQLFFVSFMQSHVIKKKKKRMVDTSMQIRVDTEVIID